MANLWKGVRNWFRARKDDAAEAIADPVRDAKYDIEDSEKQIKGFESKIHNYMTTNRGTVRKRDAAKAKSKKWDGIAKQAAKDGNESDVAEAASKKMEADREFKTFDSEVKTNEKIIANLRKQLEAARSKVARAKSNSAQLAARLEGAKVRTELAEAARGFNDSSPLACLDNLEHAVHKAEDQADAADELFADSGSALEEKYSGDDANVDDAVAQYMAAASK